MTADRIIQVGTQVLYHHPDDGHDYPALICAIRYPSGETGNETLTANLTIFRPGRIEWKWASQGIHYGGWSCPVA